MNLEFTETETFVKDELYLQYNWFHLNFLPLVQQASNEFFSELFNLKLSSLSKNMNILAGGEDYFVTKIRIDKQHDVFFRSAEGAIKIILEEVLGGTGQKFDLSKITELESKVISSFNDYVYNAISPLLLVPPPDGKKRKNYDTIYLTFFLQNKKTLEGGKYILALPQILLSPSKITPTSEKFDVSSFKKSSIDVNIKVGTTKFPVKALKQLGKEDIVIFENSNIQTMQLIYKDYKNYFRITPNPGLIMTLDDNNGGDNMESHALSQSLWDNIQVEMGAEFDTVKISLGELKNIEQGLVVDISSVYNNKISLKVENKIIAAGELVIINDRYGVRIDEVYASENQQAQEVPPQDYQSDFEETTEHYQAEEESETDEEFDYSDFELDEQDI